MHRRDFLITTAAATLAASTPWTSSAEPRKRPNIVLIMADDLGYGHLGCYGQKIIQTPNLDRLATQGIRFTQAYSGSSLCAPSRSSLLTGTHTGHTAVRGNEGGIPLPLDEITLGEVLQSAGYRTGLFGKWGLGDANTPSTPNRQGFDEFFGYLHQRHAHFYYTDYLWENETKYPLPGNRDGKQEQFSHDVILEKGLEFITASKDAPFFCFFSFTLPHHEWAVPKETLALYTGKFEEQPHEYRWREGYAQPAEPKATMAAMITHMDKGVGKIMEHLASEGLAEETLVLFLSDNGGADYSLACPEFFVANGLLRDYKGSLYEGGIRVPAIARWPGRLPAGAENDAVWYGPDLMPTFAKLVGAEIPEKCDGVSVQSAWETGSSSAEASERFLYWELGDEKKLARAGRMGIWKSVLPSPDAPMELYDLSQDPGESTNVADQHPEIVTHMRKPLDVNHQPPPPQIEPGKPDSRQFF